MLQVTESVRQGIMMTLFSKFTSASFRNAGDTARDLKDWPAAEAAYRDHLQESPSDSDIWVQHGHALKEQGKLQAAVDSYRRALEIMPESADVHLQLGHAFKLLRQSDDAAASYRKSYSLSPTLDAAQELASHTKSSQRMPVISVAEPHAPLADAILVEIDDVLLFLKQHDTLTGIQRTVANISQFIIQTLMPQHPGRYVFVHNAAGTDEGRALWHMSANKFLDIIAAVSEPDITVAALRAKVEEAEGQSMRLQPQAGQTYLILGAFWYGGAATRHLTMKRLGLKLGVYIYDLIPITNPEFTSEGLTFDFTMQLATGLRIFDFILTISEYVAGVVRQFLIENAVEQRPVMAVPLAHVLDADNGLDADSRQKATAWAGKIAHLRDVDFVMMVSTIEIRKNHILLIKAWQQMLREGLNPPDLVFIGRIGWRIEALLQVLESTRNLEGRVHVLSGVTDEELTTLYGACVCTAFPSFVEGWGLPVGESLSYGKACAASNRSSIPEVGGEFADYFDPSNLQDAVTVLRRLCFDRAYREERERKIRSAFRPRTWRDVGTDMAVALEQLSGKAHVPLRDVLLNPAEIFRPGLLYDPKNLPFDYVSRPMRDILTENWFQLEKFGCWLRGKRGVLRFRTLCGPDKDIVVFVMLKGAPLCGGQFATVSMDRKAVGASSSRATVRLKEPVLVCCKVLGRTDADGSAILRITYEADPPDRGEERRLFGVGLAGLCYAPADDTALRVVALEETSITLLNWSES